MRRRQAGVEGSGLDVAQAGECPVAAALARLALLTGEDAYRARAAAVIAAFAGEVTRNFFPLATMLNSAELLERGIQITVIVVLAYVFSLLTTFLPARQASRIHPAEALRYA